MAQFGELEAAIMETVWSADGPLTVREVVVRLRPERVSAYTTVQTVMEILHRKGWLARAKDGRAFRYAARAPREEYTARLIDAALAASPDRTAALVHFLADRLDDAQVDELRAALVRARAEAGTGSRRSEASADEAQSAETRSPEAASPETHAAEARAARARP